MSLTSLLLLLIVVLLIVRKYYAKLQTMLRHKRCLAKMPTLVQKSYPLVGHLYLFPKNPKNFICHMVRLITETIETTGSKLIVFSMGLVSFPVICHPDLAETILKSSQQINKPARYKAVLPFLENGLLLNNGSLWLDHRKKATPAFHFNILEKFVGNINKQAKILVNIFKNDQYDVYRKLQLCALDIICETALGYKLKSQKHSKQKIVEAVDKLQQITGKKLRNPLLCKGFYFKLTSLKRDYDDSLRVFHTFTTEIVKCRLRSWNVALTPTKQNFGKLALIDLLIHQEEGQNFENKLKNIREQVDTFMLAGHDTVTSALGWICYTLSRHKNWFQLCQQEADSLFATNNFNEIRFDQLKKMNKIEMFIKETLRLYAPVPLIGRELSEDLIVDEILLPSSMDVYISVQNIHKNPMVWKNPEVFDPLRFQGNDHHRYAFIPFSAGPRNCIGWKFAMAELKIIVAHLVGNFNMETNIREDQLKTSSGLVHKLENLDIKLITRSI